MGYVQERSDHPVKQQVRDAIVADLKMIKENGDEIQNQILTLPSLNFYIETEALKLGYNVYAAERDKKTYCKQVLMREEMHTENIKDSHGKWNLRLNEERAFSFLYRTPSKRFDLVYLDTCGEICDDSFYSLLALGNRKTPIVYATFLFSREKHRYNHLVSKDNRIEDYENNVFRIANYKIDRTFQYRNGNSNMCTFRLVHMNPERKHRTKRVLSEKKVSKGLDGLKRFGTLNGRGKLKYLTIGKKLLELGFDLESRYHFHFNRKDKTIVLTKSTFGNKVTKGRVNKPSQPPLITTNSFCKNYNIDYRMKTVDARRDNENTWILKMEDYDLS